MARKQSLEISNLIKNNINKNAIRTIGVCGGVQAGKSLIAKSMQMYLRMGGKEAILIRQ